MQGWWFAQHCMLWGLHWDTLTVSLERQLVQIGDNIGVSLKPFICPKKTPPDLEFFITDFHTADCLFLGRIQCWDITTSSSRYFTASETEKTPLLLSAQLLRSGDDSRALRYERVFLVTRWDSHPGLMPWRTVDECVVRPACTNMNKAGFSKAQMCLAW